MGLTKRNGKFYVEFRSVDDDGVLTLPPRGTKGAKIKRWCTGTNNKTETRRQEAKIKTDLMMGKIQSGPVHGPVTFNALEEAYLDFPAIKRQSSYKWKVSIVRGRFISLFGKKLLTAISSTLIDKFREERRKDQGYGGTTLKVATINRSLALLKHMFSYAIREEWLEKNPVSQIQLEKENNVRDRVLDPEEFDRLQDNSAPHLRAINEIAYQTGMRLGEILGLTWDRVDFKTSFIQLRAEDTKTDDARLIPLSPELTVLLKDLYKVRYLHEPHVFLVKGNSVSSIKTAFNAACRRAGIERFRFHDLRHTAVTNMRRSGIDHLTIMQITGHKTLEVFKRYNSFLEGDLKEAARRLNTFLTLAHQAANTFSHNSLISHDTRL